MQNISKYLKMSVANIGKLQENTAALCKISAKLSGWTLSDDPNMQISGWNVLDVIHSGVNGGAHPGVNGGAHPGVMVVRIQV